MLLIVEQPFISEASEALIKAAAHTDHSVSLVLLGDGVYAQHVPVLIDMDIAVLDIDAQRRGISIAPHATTISAQAFARLSRQHPHWITL